MNQGIVIVIFAGVVIVLALLLVFLPGLGRAEKRKLPKIVGMNRERTSYLVESSWLAMISNHPVGATYREFAPGLYEVDMPGAANPSHVWTTADGVMKKGKILLDGS